MALNFKRKIIVAHELKEISRMLWMFSAKLIIITVLDKKLGAASMCL